MPNDLDLLSKLQPASWRGIQFAVMDQSEFRFGQEQAMHRLILVDRKDKLIESLGRENPTYSFSSPFRENLLRGPYVNQFTKVYPLFVEACLDPSPGILIDPIDGAKQCKCVMFRAIRSAQRRDGVDVEVEFVLSPDEDETVTGFGSELLSLQGAQNLAGLFDAAAKKIDWEQEPSPQATLDPFDTITSIGNQLEANRDKFKGKLHDVAFRAERAAATIDRLKKPELASTRAAALRLQGSVLQLEESASIGGGPRPIRFVTTTANQGVATLASLHGMTVEEVLKLNPILARSPLVKANSEVRVYFDSSPANARTR